MMNDKYLGCYNGVEVFVNSSVPPGRRRSFPGTDTYHSVEEFHDTPSYKNWKEAKQETLRNMILYLRKDAKERKADREKKLKPVYYPRYDAVFEQGVGWLNKQ